MCIGARLSTLCVHAHKTTLNKKVINFRKSRDIEEDGIGEEMNGSNINIDMAEILRSFKFKNGSTKFFFFLSLLYNVLCSKFKAS